MTRILVPSSPRPLVPSAGSDSWRQFLAKPDLHWVVGYSARTVAHAWEAADGFPPKVAAILDAALGPTELLLATPEHKTPLPGGRRERAGRRRRCEQAAVCSA